MIFFFGLGVFLDLVSCVLCLDVWFGLDENQKILFANASSQHIVFS